MVYRSVLISVGTMGSTVYIGVFISVGIMGFHLHGIYRGGLSSAL